MSDALVDFLTAELQRPVAPEIRALAEACRRRHGAAALGVLFYGACLWRDRRDADSLVDFYVLVDDYAHAYSRRWLAWANRLLPPNVFYFETESDGELRRVKYAVISLADFAAGCRIEASAIAIWARFAQPTRLVWARDDDVARRLAADLATACRTFLTMALPLLGARAPAETERLWKTGFAATYAAELRPEAEGRSDEIVAADPARYAEIARLALPGLAPAALDLATASALWRRKRWVGKALNAARLVKAIFTFEGAVDYALYKVARHSGIKIAASEWERRHPLLALPGLLWKLWRAGLWR